MKKNYLILLVVVALLSVKNVSAQIGWTVYNSSTSILPTATFKAVTIDNSGNIWAGGSYTGMYKFNGTTWTHYSTSNSTLLHSDVNDLVVDNSGYVWVANYKGVSVWNGTTFINYDTTNAGFNGMTVYTLGKDNNGLIWLSSRNGSFGYEGITTYNGSAWTNLTGFPSQLNGHEFTDFAFSSSNLAWLGNDNGMANYSSSFTFYPYATTGIWSSDCIAIDGTGTVWAGGFDGLIKYNGSTWTMYGNASHFGFPSNTFFYDILVDGNILWIGTAKGLLKVDRATATVLANYNSLNSPLADNCVVGIKKDASGNLWLATTIGVVKMNPALVGVEENKSAITLNMFPNPSSDVLNVELAGNADNQVVSYHVMNIAGSVIASGVLYGGINKIDVSALSSGVYFFRTFDAELNESSMNKFVVTH
jgi:ligand-binding sensor domain-containing protein